MSLFPRFSRISLADAFLAFATFLATASSSVASPSTAATGFSNRLLDLAPPAVSSVDAPDAFNVGAPTPAATPT
ncbi:MAG: hypothetical protein IJE77_08505, partial [Thermoguttaceae bacterium]|nr:hypothetical protein [Thermoguttaceae bacterium]